MKPNHSTARVILTLEARTDLANYEDLAEAAGVTPRALQNAIQVLRAKHRLVRDQAGYFLLLAEKPPKPPIPPLTKEEIQAAIEADRRARRKAPRPQQLGWIREAVLGHAQEVLPTAPPDDRRRREEETLEERLAAEEKRVRKGGGKTKLCQVCFDMSWQRPRNKKCACGKRWEPELVDATPVRASSLSTWERF